MKVDLHKAYEKVSRKFIYLMLLSMGFSVKFANIIYESISTSTFSIIFDGYPLGYVNSNRGKDKQIHYLHLFLLLLWNMLQFF